MKKQTKKYGVYYIGSPYGNFDTGDLCYQTDVYDRCFVYIGKHNRLYGQNSVIRDKHGARVA